MSLIDPDKQGFLHKQRVAVLWKRYWFALKSAYLYYFNDPEDINAAGILQLMGGHVQSRGDDAFSFEATDSEGHTHVFAADRFVCSK